MREIVSPDQKARDQKAYDLAKEFLLSQARPKITEERLESDLSGKGVKQPSTLPEVYYHLLDAARNANRKRKVIGGPLGDDLHRLAEPLCDFDPYAVVHRYGDDWKQVLENIIPILQTRKPIRQEPQSIWPQYCQTILSGARFLAKFDSLDEFREFVELFDRDDRSRPALAMLIDHEVKGIGLALACDFLKEMGYFEFGKPDVQLRFIFTALGLCPSKPTDYELFQAIVRVAKNVGVKPYNADKLFWLTGSGYSRPDGESSREKRMPSQKEKFIEYARPKLGITP